jgi:hypothetical protein
MTMAGGGAARRKYSKSIIFIFFPKKIIGKSVYYFYKFGFFWQRKVISKIFFERLRATMEIQCK